MRIKTKLQIIAILPVIAFLVAGVVLLLMSRDVNKNHDKQDIETEISKMTSDLIILTYEYGVLRSDRPRIQWANQYSAMGKLLKEIPGKLERPLEKSLLNEINNNYKTAGLLFSELSEYDKRNSVERASPASLEFRNNMISRLILELQAIMPPAGRLVDITHEDFKKKSHNQFMLLIVFILSMASSIPLLSLVLISRISKALTVLQKGMQMVASGDLEHRVNMDTKDEIGVLAQGFDEMTAHLSSITVSRDELVQEVEERKQAEEAFRKSEEKLKEAQQVAHVGSWDWNATTDTIWWSDEYYHIYNIDPKLPPPNYTEHLKAYTPESIAKLDAAVKKAMETGEPYELDLELANPTAETRWVVARGNVKRDTNGRIIGLRGTAQNINERKRAEEALKESEQRLQLHVWQTPLAVIEWDTGFHVISWNPAAEKIFGYSFSEALGHHAEFIVPVSARPHVDRVWNDLLLLKGGERSTNENVSKDGRTILCEWYNTPLITADGRVIGVASLVQDITERKLAEEEIRKLNEELEQRVALRTADLEKAGAELQGSQRALMNIVEDLNSKTDELEQANIKLKDLDRLKSMFISSMSHELRTPLNSIIGFSSILLNGWVGPTNDEQKQNLATILKAGKHLLTLINDVIDISKIEAGRIEVTAENFEIRDLITETAELLAKDAEDKGLDLKIESVQQVIYTDRRRLMQCLINLLSNAVKFTSKGSVQISVRKLGDFIEISVSDTGIGIKEEDIKNLFQPFVRLDSPLRGTVSGTGLGLYLTRKLVIEVLKGDIICDSTYETGSCFTIRIPVKI